MVGIGVGRGCREREGDFRGEGKEGEVGGKIWRRIVRDDLGRRS